MSPSAWFPVAREVACPTVRGEIRSGGPRGRPSRARHGVLGTSARKGRPRGPPLRTTSHRVATWSFSGVWEHGHGDAGELLVQRKPLRCLTLRGGGELP